MNGEEMYYAGEYDLTHPANSALREAAFPKGLGLEAPSVVRPDRVQVYVRPDYPELDAWTYKLIVLSAKMYNWLDTPLEKQLLLTDKVIAGVEEFAAWHERYAGYIEVIGDVVSPAFPQLSNEAFQQLRDPPLRRPIPTAKVAAQVSDRTDVVLKKLRARNARIVGPSGAFTAEFDDLLACYPRHKKTLSEWADKNYPGASSDG